MTIRIILDTSIYGKITDADASKIKIKALPVNFNGMLARLVKFL